jgi:hypothetical protein
MAQLTAKLLQASPDSDEFRAILLDFQQERETILAEQARVESEKAELIAFSNQTEFIVGGQVKTLGQVFGLTVFVKVPKAQSKLAKAYQTLGQDFPETIGHEARLVAEAWDVLHAIKLGKQLQGEKFDLGYETRKSQAVL